MNVHLLDLKAPYGPQWSHSEDGQWHVKGYVFDSEEKPCEGQAFLNLLAHIQTGAEFEAFLKQANGSFAIVRKTELETWAAVDRIRSLPLWFWVAEGQTVITDSPTKQPHFQPNADQIALFPYAGHTLGKATLWKQLLQIPAGAWLCNYYYRFSFRNYFSPADAFTARVSSFDFSALATRTFKRMLASAPDAHWVVPLSGGYDSRFIAAMFKQLGCENVTCFTYGRPGSYEVEISQKVAEKLGYEWHFVPYNQETLAPYVGKQGFEYQDFASAMSSVAHEQDWTAVRLLKEKGVLPENSVFVPGYGGDVLAGSWLPKIEQDWDTDALVSYLMQPPKFFSGRRELRLNEKTVRGKIDFEVRTALTIPPYDLESAYAALHHWGFRNRLSKLLVNAVRVYDYWGYEWRLPFFDSEWMDAWLALPLVMKRGKYLYLNYLREWLFEPMGIDFTTPVIATGKWRKILKQVLPADSIDWLKARFANRDRTDVNNEAVLASLFCAHHGWDEDLPERLGINYLMGSSYLERLSLETDLT